MTINEQLGLTEIYHHDINESTGDCEKCHKHYKELLEQEALKLCPVIGREEVAQFRHPDAQGDDSSL